MKIIVNLTGPDYEPSAEMKWYAQVDLLNFINIPTDYAFGPTPEKALENLIKHLTENGIEL